MIGPSEPEARQIFLVNESKHGSETSNGLRMHHAATLVKDDHFTNNRTLDSSSSSCSSSGDPFELDADEISKSYTGDIGVPKHSKNAQFALEDHDKDIPISSMPWQEQHPNQDRTLSSNNGSTTQFPPTQVMERPADSNPSDSYRIPSSVFARTRSNGPMEWSVASNESLFSIYMGNMSFTRDHQNWLAKSGELVRPSDYTSDSTLSNPLIDFSRNEPPSKQHPINKSTDIGSKNPNVGKHLSVIESKAAETMRGVVKKDEEDGNKERSLAKGSLHSASLSRRSDASGASVKSFAFPILSGFDKSYSLAPNQYPSSRHQSQPQTPKSAQSPQVQLESQPVSEPEPEPMPKKSQNVAPGKWFSCFPCSSLCS